MILCQSVMRFVRLVLLGSLNLYGIVPLTASNTERMY